MIEEENEEFLDDIKLNSNTATYSISAFNDDASTYMGVKSINEEQSITTNGTNNKKQKNKNKKIKKKPSFSSITESSDSDSSTQRKKSSNKITNQKKVEKEEKEKNENISNDNKEKDIEKIKTLFEWDDGGDLVYLTGSFCEWKNLFK